MNNFFFVINHLTLTRKLHVLVYVSLLNACICMYTVFVDTTTIYSSQQHVDEPAIWTSERTLRIYADINHLPLAAEMCLQKQLREGSVIPTVTTTSRI